MMPGKVPMKSPLQRLEDGAKKDQVLSNSFGLLRHHRAEPTPTDAATEDTSTEAMRLALAQKVKREEMLR